MHTQILIILASESVKFLAFCYRGGKCIQQEDSDMVKVKPLLLFQQRRNNTSITYKDLTEGSFCHRRKMLLNNPHLIIKHWGLACALHLAGAHGLKSCLLSQWIVESMSAKSEFHPRPTPHYHTLLPKNRAWELMKGWPGLLANLLTASWRERHNILLLPVYCPLRRKI